jgi:hypothetical protein
MKSCVPFLALKNKSSSWRLGMMVHTCNVTYSGGRDRRIEIQGRHGQKVTKTSSRQINWVWGYKSDPSYVGGISRRILIQGGPLAKSARLCLKK